MSQAKPSRIVLLEPCFQLRLAGEFILLQVFLTALFAGGLYLFMNSEIQAGLASAHAGYRSLSQMLMPIVVVLSFFSVVISTILVVLFVVNLSHRIARPLLRIRAVLEELARRRFLDHTGLHPGDQLYELSDSLTRALTTIKADLHGIQETTASLRQAHDAGDAEAVATQLATLEAMLKGWTR